MLFLRHVSLHLLLSMHEVSSWIATVFISPPSVISFFLFLDCQLSADWLVFSSKCSLYLSFLVCDFSWTFFINYSLNKLDDLCFPCSFVPFCGMVCTLFQGGWWAQSVCQVIAHQLSSCSEITPLPLAVSSCVGCPAAFCMSWHLFVVLQQYSIDLCFICAPE